MDHDVKCFSISNECSNRVVLMKGILVHKHVVVQRFSTGLDFKVAINGELKVDWKNVLSLLDLIVYPSIGTEMPHSTLKTPRLPLAVMLAAAQKR